MGDVVSDREIAWVEVQKKAFIHWINTLLEQGGSKKVTNLDSFSDGVTVVTFIGILCEKQIRYVTQEPKLRIEKINNINLALEVLKAQGMRDKYLTISAEDFVDNNTKFILGFLWTVFHRLRIAKSLGSMDGDADSTKRALLDWVRTTTEGYKGVNIVDMRTSFNDGNALMALVHAHNPDMFDYESQVSEHSIQENIEMALGLSEKHLNIPQLINAEDLARGQVDERTLMLYMGMFYNAFSSIQQAKEMEQEKKRASEKVSDLELELEFLSKKATNKEQEYSELCSAHDEQVKKNEELNRAHAELQVQHQALLDEHAHLKRLTEQRVNMELSALALLRKNLLEHLTDMHTWKGRLSQKRVYNSESVQLKANAEIADLPTEDQIGYLRTALSEENARLQSLLQRYHEEEKDPSHSESASSSAADLATNLTPDSGLAADDDGPADSERSSRDQGDDSDVAGEREETDKTEEPEEADKAEEPEEADKAEEPEEADKAEGKKKEGKEKVKQKEKDKQKEGGQAESKGKSKAKRKGQVKKKEQEQG